MIPVVLGILLSYHPLVFCGLTQQSFPIINSTSVFMQKKLNSSPCAIACEEFTALSCLTF